MKKTKKGKKLFFILQEIISCANKSFFAPLKKKNKCGGESKVKSHTQVINKSSRNE